LTIHSIYFAFHPKIFSVKGKNIHEKFKLKYNLNAIFEIDKKV
jgi:hypothetical protein